MIPIRYNVRSLLVRRATSIMTALGVALVVMILFILLGFVGGLQATLLEAGAAGNFVITRRGAPSEPASYVTHEQLNILRVRPEIVVDGSGVPLISPELIGGLNVGFGHGRPHFTFLRGARPIALKVHRNMQIVSGHWPERGRGEWAVGRKLEARFPELSIGSQFHYGRRNWTIVGIFSDADSARESEVWTDFDDLAIDAENKELNANTLHAVLKPGMADSFKAALRKDSRLPLDAIAEPEFFAAQADFASQLRSLGLVVALTLGIGAIFGGMNTMYAAVARRGREIGVLRALGFSRGNVLMSFVAESLLIGLCGGIIGETLALALAHLIGLDSRLMNVGMFLFSYRPTMAAFAAGLAAAATIGILGGLVPAWRASQIGVNEALREA